MAVSGTPPTGKKSAGKKNYPNAKTGALSAKQDAPGRSDATAGKSKGGAKRKGMR